MLVSPSGVSSGGTKTAGLILRDLLRGGEIWLIDEAMEKNAPLGVEMAARLLRLEGFAMTARIIVPVAPDLIEQVFDRAPALRARPGEASLHKTRASRSAIYRAAPWPLELMGLSSASSADRTQFHTYERISVAHSKAHGADQAAAPRATARHILTVR